ncbi:MAG: putative N-acetylmannosamine-6-phosphate 2-epimerase [Chloroflexi bacterium]|nr:putative N-acetylmannosamine-6-phosphate 2-epimerase [Chloroflexota bacterium]
MSVQILQGGLIVSCQARPEDVLTDAGFLADMARAAEAGGAVAIRANGPRNIEAIRDAVDIPIIGIYKQDWRGVGTRITPTIDAARAIYDAGASAIAFDATRRWGDEGRPSPAEMIARIHADLDVVVMADISTFDEGIAAAEAGADLIATTLSGYTDYSPQMHTPDYELVKRLSAALEVPVVMEGRISTPDEAARGLRAGAFAVVVGSMITRPRFIVSRYVAAMRPETDVAPVIAVDIGGTKIAAAIMLPSGDLAHATRIPTEPQRGGEDVLVRAAGLVADLRTKAPDAASIGVSTGGEVDSLGRVRFATSLLPGWTGMRITERMQAQFDLLTVTDNDGVCAAAAEALRGAGQGYDNVLGVAIGTGLGAGWIVDGRPMRLRDAASLKLGHMPVDPEGLPCTCGLRGCLETRVSGPALALAYAERAGVDPMTVTGQTVQAAAESGDPAALAAIGAMARWLAIGLASAVDLLRPNVIVIGGSVAGLGDLLFGPLRSAFAERVYPSLTDTLIVSARYGGEAGLVGAGLMAQQLQRQGPSH